MVNFDDNCIFPDTNLLLPSEFWCDHSSFKYVYNQDE